MQIKGENLSNQSEAISSSRDNISSDPLKLHNVGDIVTPGATQPGID